MVVRLFGTQCASAIRLVLTCLAWLAVSSIAPCATTEKLWLAVTTQELAPGVKTLAERRRAEGFQTEVFVGQPDEALVNFQRPDYLLLVGDVATPGEASAADWQVGSRTFPLYRWHQGQREKFLSDSMWGDLDNDGVPEVPVGRLPARSTDELGLMVKKIIAYEDRSWTSDDLRLPIWTGDPMASPAFNHMATGLIVSEMRLRLPRWSEVSLICGDATSPFCGWAPDQARTFHRWLRRGGVFATVGAHGSKYSWYSVSDHGQGFFYDVRQQGDALQNGEPACPLLVFTCDSGDFAAEGRCVTEVMVLAPGGPVAAVGATTESHPLPNCFTLRGLEQVLTTSPDRLGDLWLQSLRSGCQTRDAVLEFLTKDLEGSLEEQIDVTKLRRDQMRMYALMGDPATRIRIPHKLAATVRKTDEGWAWEVDRPRDATTLYVHIRTDEAEPPVRPNNVGQQKAGELQEEANRLFAYEPVQTLTEKQNWSGIVNQHGELRLVAVSPSVWYAAVLKVGD